ncbi:MAG: sulfite oxidase-like oxidoreductase [Flavobacteriales bacterium]|jgi:DMSO/TMAO reductase YedYZ molybdopterin-dependent catalytic subunit|nr:MAG: sulfite oxidase-like oxidoreductase [Flavobacteriales bacterium]
MPINRSFGGRNRGADNHGGRLPPGQSLTDGFPVLTAGPTPRTPSSADWGLTIKIGPKPVRTFSWEEFHQLPQTEQVVDIHCVTTWSKFDTRWRGVSIDDLLVAAGFQQAPTPWVLAHSLDGYSTNVPLADLAGGRAMVATYYDGKPLPTEHGGPARLLVPHLYFWKSAKWVNALQFTAKDEAGFWELRGYHMRGDPFKEERYG